NKRKVTSYRCGCSGDQCMTFHSCISDKRLTSTCIWGRSEVNENCFTGFPSKRILASTLKGLSYNPLSIKSKATLFSSIFGVILTCSMCSSGRNSNQTVCQIPVVCTYQQPKFSSVQ